MDERDVSRAAGNIPVIIGYLRSHFHDFTIRVEERPPNRIVFSLTNLATSEQLMLVVLWPTLGERHITSDLIQQKMNESDLAGKLKSVKNYLWTVGT